MAETTTEITDEQLLDLYMTAWVAGCVDLGLSTLAPQDRDHVVGCSACTEGMIQVHRAHLTQLWEDPAARAAIIDISRAVLAQEDRAPTFVTVHHRPVTGGN